MKIRTISILMLLAVMGFYAPASAQGAAAGTPAVSFNQLSHDFGNIRQGKPVFFEFLMKNEGKTPLLIERVDATCGCTSPVWSKDPVPPGGQTVIRVGFNAFDPGPFSKDIAVLLEGGSVRTLTIRGVVHPVPATPAPPHPSLSLIK